MRITMSRLAIFAVLVIFAVLAIFAVPAVASDARTKPASPLRIKIAPMGACPCCAPRISWEEKWLFVDTETDLPITHALGWDFLKEPGRWECQKMKRLDFDWSHSPEEEGFDGFVIAGCR